ncbi:protein rep, partial [Pseudonocardia sp. D17]|uniref:protein rep n=1 Tax=Pseudonocardia sp. D17 TaxID=882661 RepID=UPI00403F64A6
ERRREHLARREAGVRATGQQQLIVPQLADVHRLPGDGLSGLSGVVEREEVRRARQAARRGGAADPALVKTQSYETQQGSGQLSSPSVEVSQQRMAIRYNNLDTLRWASTKKRVRQCKTAIGNGNVGIVDHGDKTGAHFVGVESCANVWCCPVCAPKIRAGRTSDVTEAFRLHLATGGGFLFLTQTVQHNHGERLAFLLELLGKGWQHLANSRTYKAARKRYGILGNITALEITHGVTAGWHPHRHLLIFTKRPLSTDEVADLEAAMHAVYSQWMRKQGKVSKAHVGLRIDQVTDANEAVGKYITKMQASYELTRSDLKQSRAAKEGGTVPFDFLLRLSDDHRDETARRLWQEYEQATTGKSAVRFSKGLRKLLGMEPAKTDDELAEEEAGGDTGVFLAAPLFRRMTKAGHRGLLLWTATNKGDLGIIKLVQLLYPGEYLVDELEVPGSVVIG